MMKTCVLNNGQNRQSGPGLGSELDFQSVEFPSVLKLMPMVNFNIYPGITSSICAYTDEARETVLKSYQGDRLVALFALKSLNVDPKDLRKDDFFSVGVAAEILSVTEQDNGRLKANIVGVKRILLVECVNGDIPQVVTRPAPVEVWDEKTLSPLVREVRRLYTGFLSYHQGKPADPFMVDHLMEEEPTKLADLIMSTLPIKKEKKIEFLLIENIVDRFQKVLEHLNWELSDREAAAAIGKRVEESLSRQDRESRLREQIKAIRV
ncbi:MAG: LON peptidase substrate-binding domain-containing protein [Deltaproteobacteria bacterium]|jgi:ATP-dependent Lon protease|nr:LON peptidase substrate-binding domain-containing protein [Deltaproteobacteria bacterium]